MFEGMTVGQIRAEARKDAKRTLDDHWDGLFPVNPVPIAQALGEDPGCDDPDGGPGRGGPGGPSSSGVPTSPRLSSMRGVRRFSRAASA